MSWAQCKKCGSVFAADNYSVRFGSHPKVNRRIQRFEKNGQKKSGMLSHLSQLNARQECRVVNCVQHSHACCLPILCIANCFVVHYVLYWYLILKYHIPEIVSWTPILKYHIPDIVSWTPIFCECSTLASI